MALPEVSLRQLLEAGVHFGHQSHRWNPKMGSYIFGERNKIHILDLAQTVPLFSKALKVVSDTVAKGGRVLIVGTKRQASELVADAAKRSAQYYVNSRWLGGMLTNWKTISNSIQRLRKVEQMLESEQGFTKKERLTLSRELEKLNRALGGIRDMGGLPDLIVVIDTNKEALAIKEAQRLGIPVAAILDSNCDPAGITYPIPGNDDAGRAIALYCDLIARAAIDGIGRSQSSVGQDIGASENPFLDEAQSSSETVAGLERLTAPRGTADDLSKLAGVGPALEKKLNEYGIFHYWQVAGLSDDAVAAVDAELKLSGRIQRDGWVAQAGTLAE
jgi:small subunit ribosomal protein S2